MEMSVVHLLIVLLLQNDRQSSNQETLILAQNYLDNVPGSFYEHCGTLPKKSTIVKNAYTRDIQRYLMHIHICIKKSFDHLLLHTFPGASGLLSRPRYFRIDFDFLRTMQLSLVELQEVGMGPPLKCVKVPLDGITSLQRVDCTTEVGIVSKFAKGTLIPNIHVTNKDVK
ncbi:sushi repeat-containing protein srpx [Limosa lapponica baueri]|uniref:Sushi repeat-containing protein srpx n=1 Tax=Limosa lapponica baueri TaxID=1758121 RepID=A0A2I0UBH4_LIMLA|nr:sushi repeat-containing protein srpx [Limosa lapponica baueri]